MARFSVVKLPGRGEGWAVFDSLTGSTVVGTRCATKREATEAAVEAANAESVRAALEQDRQLGATATARGAALPATCPCGKTYAQIRSEYRQIEATEGRHAADHFDGKHEQHQEEE